MTKTLTEKLTKAPFKADHVGSLLRPEILHNARKKFQAGEITAEQLREVETTEIKRLSISKLKLD